MEPQYVFCLDGGGYVEMYRTMLSDILPRPDVHVMDNPYVRTDKVLKNKTFSQWQATFDKYLPGIDPTMHWCSLNSLLRDWPRNQSFYLILFNPAMERGYSAAYLRKLRRRFPAMRLVFLLVDRTASPKAKAAMRLFANGVPDITYTVDGEDAEKYGMHFVWQMLPTNLALKANETELYNLYYCAYATENRKDTIVRAAQLSAEAGLPFRFDLVYNDVAFPKGTFALPGIQHQTKVQPYLTVLEQVQKAHCVLDITQPGQKALTLRPYEAVLSNKRLLTNNPEIVRFPYYDAKYMRIFTTMTAEDIAWAAQPEQPDYQYRGEFSAECFLQRLLQDDAERRT